MLNEGRVVKIYVIPGRPVPLQRARVTSHGAYDPQSIEKQDHRALLRDQRGAHLPLDHGPLELSVVFYMQIPKSNPKNKPLTGKFHTKRPDLDNLVKYVLDVAQPILITDDAFISTIIAEKVYDENPRTEISISILD